MPSGTNKHVFRPNAANIVCDIFVSVELFLKIKQEF